MAGVITNQCQDALKRGGKSAKHEIIVRTKAPTAADAEVQEQLRQAVKTGQMATRRSQVLALAQKRYGSGQGYLSNFRDSREEAYSRMRSALPKRSATLWLAGAVAIEATADEVQDLAKHNDIVEVDLNRRFAAPEPLRTPLEDTPEAIDGSAWGVAKSRAVEAWGGFGRGEGVLVGHLDTGIDAAHPALAGRLADFAEFDPLGNPVPGAPPRDSGLHGTHTAGTICGRNFHGINIGVAPEAQLLSALVLNGGSGSFAQIVAGMQWTVTEGADVMSMSLGGSGYFTDWNLPVVNALLSGTLVVASIGNSGHGTSGGPGNDALAFGVGATHHEDAPAGFSGGRTLQVPHELLGDLDYIKPDISAPGVQTLSSTPNEGLEAFSGTSMAAPHVAGAAALALSAAPGLRGDPFTIMSVLLGGVEDFGEAGRDQRFGFGRLDAHTACQIAVSMPGAAGAASAAAGGIS